MKPVLTFVLGALLASAIAVFLVNRNQAPASDDHAVATTTLTPSTEPVEPVSPDPATAPPDPIVESRRTAEGRVPARVAPQRSEPRGSRAATGSPTFSSTGNASQRPTPAEQNSAPQNTTSTSPNAQGGPPQTTLSMPPPPEGQSMANARPAAPARVPTTVTIPAGTRLTVRVDERLSSDTVQTGDTFRATLDQALVVDGAVIAERGARVEGRVAQADPGGKVRGSASLALELVRLNTSDGQRVRLQTEGFTQTAPRSTKKDAAKVGLGAGLGAAIGAIAGGGKGAAIGAGVGGAAGTGAVLTSRGDPAEIPAETRMTFSLREAITVTEKLN